MGSEEVRPIIDDTHLSLNRSVRGHPTIGGRNVEDVLNSDPFGSAEQGTPPPDPSVLQYQANNSGLPDNHSER